MRKRIYKEKLYCHNCESYQIFEWDIELTGNQIFYCPLCSHPHYRIMENDTRIKILIMPKLELNYENPEECIETLEPAKHRNGNSISRKRWFSANG